MKYTQREKDVNKNLYLDLVSEIYSHSSYKIEFYNKLHKDIYKFLDSITMNNVDLFIRARNYFVTFYPPLNSIRHSVQFQNAYSSYLLILLFSLIEGIMQEEKFLDCIPFLQNKSKVLRKISDTLNVNVLSDLSTEYRERFGANKKVKRFFKLYIEEEDKNYILSQYKNGIYSEADKFISDIYQLRSNFVHNLGLESLTQTSSIEIRKFDETINSSYLEKQRSLNINDLVIIVWNGIFKKLGFD